MNSTLYVTVTKPKREFSVQETVFAWLSLLLGYFFCRTFPVTEKPLFGFLFVVTVFAVTSVFLKFKGVRIKATVIVCGVSAVAAAASMIMTSDPAIHFFSYSYAAAAYCFFVYTATGNSLEAPLSDLFAADFIRAAFVVPFASFTKVFDAILSKKKTKGTKTLLNVLLGLAIAFVPTITVTALLCYDKGFSHIMGSIFRTDFDFIFENVLSILLGIPVGMYIFGLYLSSSDKKCCDEITAEGCRKTADNLRIMPQATALTVTLPLLVVYAVFFVSQWKYYVSGFVGVLPDSQSYAGYARNGFFQLLFVSFINLAILCAISLFMKKSEDSKGKYLKAISAVISACTLLLISTAAAKMTLYVSRFGLTLLRVYASWFMVLLAAVFLVVLIKQFAGKIKLIPVSVCICAVLFLALSLFPVNSMIASYNTNRYIDGSISEIDVSSLSELGDSAIPQIVRLGQALDKKNGTNLAQQVNDKGWHEKRTKESTYNDIVECLKSFSHNRSKKITSFTFARAAADRALESSGIKITWSK